MIDLTLILAAGVASGTVLLFAAVGELFAERAAAAAEVHVATTEAWFRQALAAGDEA